MAVTEEAPLGFAGDVDGNASFRLTGGDASHGSAPARVERLPPPSLRDDGLLGGGAVLTGVESGRSVVSWRAQESGLWVEERGLDDDLVGGGLHLKLEGGRAGVSVVLRLWGFGGMGGGVLTIII